MPRRRRIAKLRTTPFEYGETHALFLQSGYDYFHESPFCEPPDRDLMRDCWRDHGEELLAEYVATRPGCRPWGWWQFESQETRAEDETETEYLERLGLLLPGEREVMEGKKHDHS